MTLKKYYEGDTHLTRWQVPGADLTGTTLIFRVKRDTDATVVLTAVPSPEEDETDVFLHYLTGALPVGDYVGELEVTDALGRITTIRNDSFLFRIDPQLG